MNDPKGNHAIRIEDVPRGPQSSRGRVRYARIIDAATELFLRDGYAATSIDNILSLAGGSKATLYSYFPTKDDLFRAVIDGIVGNRKAPELGAHDNIRATLEAHAIQRLTVIFSGSHRALLRVIIGEQKNFPDLAREYHQRGPRRSRELLADYLSSLDGQEALIIDDAAEAADFFAGMLVHQWYGELLLLAAKPPTPAAIKQRAGRVVERFLAAYRG